VHDLARRLRGALDLTSEYIKTRKQFDQPIAMFQAVGHRAADAFIDTEAIRSRAGRRAGASRRVSTRRSRCGGEVLVCRGRQARRARGDHLHGGVGVDKEYPLHRYFLRARQLELALGGGTLQLLKLGKLLAADA
jgi:alkylation response protein AidB-like acyl-CoA dehydrogenase